MKNKKPWKTRYVVVILFTKDRFSKDPRVLMGPKNNGSVKGFIMPVGGQIEQSDLGYITAGHREGFEESNLRALSSRKVAELRVKIEKKRQRVIVHITRCTEWTGRLRKKDLAFEWLRFIPVSKIPWDKVPTKEDTWMKRVLIKNKKCIVFIQCGKDRRDVKRVTTRSVKDFT